MANANPKAPKQWCLTKNETVNSFENWRQNLLYTLSLDKHFAPFLVPGFQWEKRSRTSPYRGLADDGEDVPLARRQTRQQKVTMLELMLGQIANFCSVISRNTIVKNSTSIDNIWQTIRMHFGFQSTGAHFLDFSAIKFEPNERPEDLYQRLMAFIEDSLLRPDLNLTHHGDEITEEEELSPTLENLVVLTWLKLINPDLPRLVKQRYGTELRSRTLASIKPEISQALDSLLEELRTTEDAKSLRTAVSRFPTSSQKQTLFREDVSKQQSRSNKVCPLCKTANRPDNHYLSKCKFLPNQDRKYMAKARLIAGTNSDSSDDSSEHEIDATQHTDTSINRVQIRQSPYLDAFHSHHSVRLTIDSGATGNMIRASAASKLGAKLSSSSQSAHQADGSSPLKVVGETRLSFVRDRNTLYFEGLVVENLDTDILAGIPFMERNDISIRPAKRQILIGQHSSYTYGSDSYQPNRHAIRRAHVLRVPVATTIWPGEFIEVSLPADMSSVDETFAIEPHNSSDSIKECESWPPVTLIDSVSGKVRIANLTDHPRTVRKSDHLCKIRSTSIFDKECYTSNDVESHATSVNTQHLSASTKYSEQVRIDPDNVLPQEMKSRFKDLLNEFDDVFSPNFEGYNGAVGPFEAKVNMGPVQPPQRKGRLPQYSRNQLNELQRQFDDLERLGVFKRPEDIGVSVEYVNPSFLVKKPNGGFRLVTAFADVGRYSKPQPSLMPDIDSTLRQIAQWNYIITTDLTKAFYQIPLSHDSMKYCGVVTPFKGVRVYARSAMGMPGSETALEELTCRILGDLVQEGIVAKVADDLYCGGNNPQELLQNFKRVLQALHGSNINLAASKTVIAPKQTAILGWTWKLGTIHASAHRIATLSTCQPPSSVTGLRSFLGAYKILSRVIQNCSHLLAPLEDITAGRESKDSIHWNDDLLSAFTNAQKALSSNRSIVLPRPSDHLWIVTDGAVKSPGIGSTLYVSRGDSVHLAGFFSAKLRKSQATWLPCEIEALSIAAAIKHFSPYIIQSHHKACVLTDSKPCVQAYEKLCRGEFSASPRVSTFLSVASRYQTSIQHIAGCTILPSDFASRNAPDCFEPVCQICSFVNRSENCVVRSASIKDILDGNSPAPYTSRTTWLQIQSDCPDLRRTHAHLRQGTRPSKRVTNAKDVKRLLHVASIAKDGLLVVKRSEPFSPSRECVIIPRQVLDGFVMSLHLKLDHPSSHQLKLVMHRNVYALDLEKTIDHITKSCHLCTSLRQTQNQVIPQSTGEPTSAIGTLFAADVIKRNRQLIFVLREYVTSYTIACLIDNEQRETLRDALLRSCIELRPLNGPPAIVRTDSAPGFSALVNDDLLSAHGLCLETGDVKNKNKNPVAEKAIQELEAEILRQDPTNRHTTPLLLSMATARLNSRIRGRGLSARETWTQRDQFTNQQISFTDEDFIMHQHETRLANHRFSEKSKSPQGKLEIPSLQVDLIYLNSDRNKLQARDRYLVVSMDRNYCNVKKFVGSQLRKTSYRVRQSDCFKVPAFIPDSSSSSYNDVNSDSSEDDDNIDVTDNSPPQPPPIPCVISAPPVEYTDNVDGFTDKHMQTELVNHPSVESSSESVQSTRPTRQRNVPKRFDDFLLY